MEPYRGKRVFDLVSAAAAGLICAPLVATMAVATVLEDGGPAFFVQTRLGRRRLPFRVLKLRTMRDGQVTNVGRWLRRTGLDELPQFLNVWRGEMSVVGPRPLTAEDVRRLGWDSPKLDWRFDAKPGITGLSQILAGQGVVASRRLDRLYLRRQQLLVDAYLVALSGVANLIGKRRLARLILG